MSNYAAWLTANDQYLSTSLAGLRERLQRAASQPAGAGNGATGNSVASVPLAAAQPAHAAASGGKHGSWFGWMFGRRTNHVDQRAGSAAPVGDAGQSGAAMTVEVPDQQGAPATNESAVMAAGDGAVSESPVPALVLLAQRLGLTDFERDLLLLCVGMELDTRMPALCAQAQHDPTKPWPTFALAFAVLDHPSWDALSPERPLRYWRLLDIHQPGPQPLIGAALSADERIVNFVKGMNYLDDRLTPLLAPLAPAALSPSQKALADGITENLRHGAPGEPLPAVQLVGSDSLSKQAIAHAVAAAFNIQTFRLSAELLPSALAEQEKLVRLWQRESQLLPVGLYVDAVNIDGHDAGAAPVKRFLSRAGGVTFIDTREPWNSATSHTVSVDVAKPTPMEQRNLWQRLLGEASGQYPQWLAGHFDFNSEKIGQIAHSALSAAGQQPAALGETLWQAALSRTRPSLDQLAQRIEPKASWDELKLPDAEITLLHQIADQVAKRSFVYDDWGFRERMNRGLSISALFAGESGTGKTMAAEVIAKALGLSLYRIDLSAVVSKYIGETEKNLRKLFDAAEEGGAILFFDEADALFGRRSEVKDSHDRYANIEVNYLLQRVESFRGLAILATNMKGALDGAFLRRIRFIVNFPFPGVAERAAIWSSIFPDKAATSSLDAARLARLPLTGGSIQSVALNAAFLAANAGVQISMPIILEAAKTEFRKLDKPVTEADFRWLGNAGAKT